MFRLSQYMRVKDLAQPRAAVALSIIFISYVVYRAFFYPRRAPYHRFPKLGKGLLEPWLRWEPPTRWRLDDYEAEGYRKHNKRGQPFVLTMYNLETLIMPLKYLRDLKEADRQRLNFAQSFNDYMNMDASVGDIGTANEMEINIVSKCINPRLPQLVPILADEAATVFLEEIGNLQDWKAFNAFQLCTVLVYGVSNRVLVGPELCRNKQYMEACKSYATSVFISGVIWNFMHLGPLRNWVYWLGAFKHRRDLAAARKFLLPIIEARMKDTGGSEAERPLDAIQWMVDMPPSAPGEVDSYRHANRLLHLTFAGTGTIISLLQHLIWEILLHPEYLEPLRQEAKETIAEFGGWNSDKALGRMHLLDSFIRETLRMNPPGVFGGARTVMGGPYTFHDGLTLEEGTRIAFGMLSPNLDADAYNEAMNFQGFRFAGTLSKPDVTIKTSSTSLDPHFLSFGYGKQACPGRFYAMKVCKIIFGRLIGEYELQWATPTKTRPKGMVIEGMITPNMGTSVLLKRRAV